MTVASEKIRDLEHGGRRTVLLWTQRRLVCDHCGKRHIETHPQFQGCMTRRLVQDAQVMPRSGGGPPSPDWVASDHGAGYRLVRAGRDSAAPSEVSGVVDR